MQSLSGLFTFIYLNTEDKNAWLQIRFTCRQQCAHGRITAASMYMHMCLDLYKHMQSLCIDVHGLPCRCPLQRSTKWKENEHLCMCIAAHFTHTYFHRYQYIFWICILLLTYSFNGCCMYTHIQRTGGCVALEVVYMEIATHVESEYCSGWVHAGMLWSM